MKKWNHAYTLAFSVNTDHDADDPIDNAEILAAILKRVVDLIEHDELDEALGLPFDSFENQGTDL